MDYDKTDMPAHYDAARGYSPETLQISLDLISRHVAKDEVADIVDLGCGTGRYSEALAAHFDANLVGVDPSQKMLAQARGKGPKRRVSYRQGRGEALPVEDRSADLVFLSMVYHHLADPAATARECRRVLRPGGRVCLRNTTLEQLETYPYLDFFPAVGAIIAAKLSPRAEIQGLFAAAGLEKQAHEVVDHPIAANWLGYADKVALRADSFLQQIPDEDFRDGLAALRAYAENADPSAPVTLSFEFFVFRRA